MATIADLFDSSDHLITTVAGLITGYPEAIQDTVARMLTDKYFDAADKLLLTRYGTWPARTTNGTVVNMEIISYIIINARKFEKCLEYIDAEYNPVENYEGYEEEDITNTFDEVNRHGSNDKGGTSLTLEYGPTSVTDMFSKGAQTNSLTLDFGPTSTVALDEYGATSTTQTLDYAEDTTTTEYDVKQRTTTQQTAPFDTEDFKNSSKTIEDAHKDKDTQTREEREDSVTTEGDAYDVTHTTTEAARQDGQSSTDGARSDSNIKTEAARRDVQSQAQQLNPFTDITDEREDTVHRTLSRHGNLGTLTASEMILRDMQAWDGFTWLLDMAHDIANLIGSGVYTL